MTTELVRHETFIITVHALPSIFYGQEKSREHLLTHGQRGRRALARFKPLGGGVASRIQCDIGTFDNCTAVNADGTAGGAVSTGFDFTGYALIPGVLHAYKASADDLAGLVRPGSKD